MIFFFECVSSYFIVCVFFKAINMENSGRAEEESETNIENPTTTNLCVQTTSGVISTDDVPPEGWDGRAPQGCIVPLDFCSPLPPPQLKNYHSLPVVSNYPEPVAASNKETEYFELVENYSVEPVSVSLSDSNAIVSSQHVDVTIAHSVSQSQ
ncbi:uncharacterized protein [Dysidea avara]|uniref:uncharacterized protein isoform X2 n=1 Tax=Dysidea avara TaxID=196820 RepID=UPI003321B1B5